MNDDDLRSAFDDLLHDVPDGRALPRATARRVARRRGLKLGATALGGAGALVTAAALVLAVTGPSEDRLLGPAATAPATPGVSSAPSQSPASSPSPGPAPRPSTAPTSTPSSAPTTAPPVAPSSGPATAVRVVLRPDGLGFTGGGSSTSALPFGTVDATVRSAVDRALGEGGELPTPDCGPGSSTVQHENLFLLLQNGDFVGWRTGSPGLTTGDGIGVGSTLADLRAALPGVTVTEGTLGPEWLTKGGLAGFLDGTDESSLVNSLGAGVQCLAR